MRKAMLEGTAAASAKDRSIKLIRLEAPDTWPTDVLDYLNRHHELFLDWATEKRRVTHYEYDAALDGLLDALQPYAMTGWHCTRLTQAEIDMILSTGMQLPDGAMLKRRIDAVVAAGLLNSSIARRLKEDNQADEPTRAGMLWFFFTRRVNQYLVN